MHPFRALPFPGLTALQMPDILFNGTEWRPYLCAEAEIVDFPPVRIVADKPCTP